MIKLTYIILIALLSFLLFRPDQKGELTASDYARFNQQPCKLSTPGTEACEDIMPK